MGYDANAFPNRAGRLFALALFATLSPAGARSLAGTEAEKATFTVRPTVQAEGEGARIRFAVSRETDVEVAVLDAQSRVVRHLAAGVLGKNPPAPLKANALSQEVHWDGKDDAGKPAADGPFKVRVKAGMKPVFSHFIGEYPECVGTVYGLGCDDKGELYVASRSSGLSDAYQPGTLKVFNRDGKFLRQLMPYSGGLPRESLSGLVLLDRPEGGFAPKLYDSVPFWMYPYRLLYPRGIESFLFRAGKKMAFVGTKGSTSIQQLVVIGTDGSVDKNVAGPSIGDSGGRLALSPDEQTVYLSKKDGSHALYRLSWTPGETPKEFIGKAESPSDAAGQFNTPKGIGVDGAGRIYVCDSGNNRVAIFTSDGKPDCEIKIDAPEEIAVHPKTNAIYLILKGAKLAGARQSEMGFNRKLVKFDGAKSPKPSLELDLGETQLHVSFCLDAAAEKPILWLATCMLVAPPERDEVSARILKVVDEGGRLLNAGYPISMAHRPDGACGATMQTIPIDPSRDELLVFWSMSASNEKYGPCARVDGLTGKFLGTMTFENAQRPSRGGPNLENANLFRGEMTWGRDGNFYFFSAMGENLLKYDPNGKGSKSIASFPSRYAMPNGITMAPDGTLYVFHNQESRTRAQTRVTRITADGKILKQDLVQINGFRCDGIHVDAKGNIYVGVRVVPKANPLPDWIRGNVENQNAAAEVCVDYASVLKFGPEGGSVESLGPAGESDSTLPKTSGNDDLLVSIASGDKGSPVYQRVKATGVLGVFDGLGHINAKGCRCYPTRFGLDAHARVFIPDTARFSVGIADTNGNPVARFGGYGNQDGRGGGVKGPDVPLTLVKAVSVSDRFCYVLDGYNHRIVAVKLSAEAEEVCAIAR